MRRYTNRFINEHNLISGRVLSAIVVLPLSLTIAACSQPNATTADSNQRLSQLPLRKPL